MAGLGQDDGRGLLAVVPVAAHKAVRHVLVLYRLKMLDTDESAYGFSAQQFM
jgi:hypothetical protein